MYQQIIYTSRAADKIGLRDVYDIIRKAHNRNCDNGLTGGLLFLDQHFIQLLEGSPHAVEQLYRRISNDKRHHSVTLRKRQLNSQLYFANEWMALKSNEDIDPAVFEMHQYVPGLPVGKFDGNQVLAFLLDCFSLVEAGVCVSGKALAPGNLG